MIATHNDCKVLVQNGSSLMKTTLYLIGVESDVRRVQMLNASLQIQATGALNAFWNEIGSQYAGFSEREKFKVRRQFVFSFAIGLNDKLTLARKAGLEGAAEQHGADSVALVIRSKEVIVQDKMDELHPTTRKVRSSFRSGGHEAAQAGRKAGQRANTGEPALNTNRGALPR